MNVVGRGEHGSQAGESSSRLGSLSLKPNSQIPQLSKFGAAFFTPAAHAFQMNSLEHRQMNVCLRDLLRGAAFQSGPKS